MEDDGSGFYHLAYDLEDHEVKGFYADWASTYDTELIDGKGYVMPRRCSEALARHVPLRTSSILDVGCGTGLLATRLQRLGYSLIDGFDYSPEMLAEAERTGLYRTLEIADVNDHLPSRDASYDAVAAVGVFSFGHVHPDALDEMSRVIRPGGILVVGVNEVFVDEGSFIDKMDRLIQAEKLTLLEREYGDHVQQSGVNGWVYVARKIGES